jgi:hypothetical protein
MAPHIGVAGGHANSLTARNFKLEKRRILDLAKERLDVVPRTRTVLQALGEAIKSQAAARVPDAWQIKVTTVSISSQAKPLQAQLSYG